MSKEKFMKHLTELREKTGETDVTDICLSLESLYDELETSKNDIDKRLESLENENTHYREINNSLWKRVASNVSVSDSGVIPDNKTEENKNKLSFDDLEF